MSAKKEEAAPAATGTTSAKEITSPEVYQPGGEKSTPNELRELRTSRGLAVKEMVAVVQGLYPKYDKTVQSKCENGDAYGVTIRRDALKALYRHFAPELLEPKKQTRHGQHRLTCRISARLENSTFAALQQRMQADGYQTFQELLTALVLRYVEGDADGT